MKASRLSLSKKVLFVTLIPFLLFGVVLQAVNLWLTRGSFAAVLDRFQTSMHDVEQQTTGDLMKMSEQSARDLLREIYIAAGGSLQPGESTKFAHLAQKQKDLEQLREFSFYAPDGKLELSSNPDTKQREVPADVLAEAKTSRAVAVRGNNGFDGTLHFYQPLFADANMVRLNPEWRAGDFYGMLHVELAKDRIRQSAEDQRQHAGAAIADAKQAYAKALSRITWTAVILVVGSGLLVGLIIAKVSSLAVVRPVRTAAATLGRVAREVSDRSSQVLATAQSLAQGAAEQAAGLEQTSSSMEEMAAMIKQSADNTQQANSLSSEAGKSFAVVAEEVRNLARRSADAAKDTARMIAESVANAKRGVDIAGEVQAVLDEIVQSVGKTTNLVSEIAAASREQAQGIDQVNAAIAQMDKVTQQNAANAEQSSRASEELSTQAESMNQIVAGLVALAGQAKQDKGPEPDRKLPPADHVFHDIADSHVDRDSIALPPRSASIKLRN